MIKEFLRINLFFFSLNSTYYFTKETTHISLNVIIFSNDNNSKTQVKIVKLVTNRNK